MKNNGDTTSWIKKWYKVDPSENGCKEHGDCFTCPFNDCIHKGIYDDYKRNYYMKNKDKIREYQREYQRKRYYKLKALGGTK